MSVVVDYIVYMTYNLQDQWDYGNSYADPGCPAGICLRLHVEYAENLNSLSMITKAGKLRPCVQNDHHRLLAGQCTETAGYLADAEIEAVIGANPTTQVYWDADAFNGLWVQAHTTTGCGEEGFPTSSTGSSSLRSSPLRDSSEDDSD
ncbi:hypothetical protein BJY01DRAFT_256477 [Aspergillus pseudoustus]|uniref:Chitinase n=1 Tax=Aspergillus pseudoustus TaxID=1810923 RepID=A0ABR4I9A8_9EURO